MNNTPLFHIEMPDLAGAKYIYDHYLIRHFPENEVKPFPVMKQNFQDGFYKCIAAYRENELIAYAFIASSVFQGISTALLDYFAVVEEYRNQGIGSVFLKMLIDEEMKQDYILIENESVDKAESEEDKKMREKRILFYQRSGAFHSPVRTLLFEVYYDILFLSRSGESPSAQFVYDITKKAYNVFYPKLRPEWTYKIWIDENS